jgi:hypothetical protein
MVIYMIFSSLFSGHFATFCIAESFFCRRSLVRAPPRTARVLLRQLFSAGQYFIACFLGWWACACLPACMRAANLCKLAKTTRRLDLPARLPRSALCFSQSQLTNYNHSEYAYLCKRSLRSIKFGLCFPLACK